MAIAAFGPPVQTQAPAGSRRRQVSFRKRRLSLGTLELADLFAYNVVEMPPTAVLGEFEQTVLLAILRLRERGAYGVSIRREIAACTDRKPTPGALYTTLDRLEEKGLVTSRLGDPTPSRGGRAKRYFTVTPKGVEAVARAQQSYQRLLKGLRLPGIVHA